MKREGRQDGLGDPVKDGGGVRLSDDAGEGETGEPVGVAVGDGTGVVDTDGGGVPDGVGVDDRDGVDDELISEAKLMPV